MRKPKVVQMKSTRSGEPVPNQFIIHTDEGTYFQSYATTIAFKPRGKSEIVLDYNALGYSVTTSKYLHIFMRGMDFYYTSKELKKFQTDTTLEESIIWVDLN